MRFKLILPLILLSIVLLSACGAADTAAPVAASGAVGGTLSLEPSIDVDTLAEIKDRSDVYVLDVREQWEYDEGHIPGVVLLPMSELPGRMSEIPKDKNVIVTCRTGNRSGQVTEFLRENGFENVHNMLGGIVAWEQAGYEVAR